MASSKTGGRLTDQSRVPKFNYNDPKHLIRNAKNSKHGKNYIRSTARQVWAVWPPDVLNADTIIVGTLSR